MASHCHGMRPYLSSFDRQLHDAGDGRLRSVYIAARYGAMLNLELEAILDEFMLCCM
jgi:hypothetical protein